MKKNFVNTDSKNPMFVFARRFTISLLCLLLFAYAANPLAAQTQNPASPERATLTSFQRRIEDQRARLLSFDAEIRRDAVLQLGAMNRPDSARVAALALNDRDEKVRAAATRAVLALPSEEAANLLLPILTRDRSEFVRQEAAYAAGETGSRTIVPALITALEKDKSAGVRGAAAISLGKLADVRAVPALVAALNRRVRASGFFNRLRRRQTDENDLVRRSAARSLGEIGDRSAVSALISALTNSRAGDDVRREAALALGIIGDPAAVPALRAALTSTDPYLSRIAYEALRKLEPSAAVSPGV